MGLKVLPGFVTPLPSAIGEPVAYNIMCIDGQHIPNIVP